LTPSPLLSHIIFIPNRQPTKLLSREGRNRTLQKTVEKKKKPATIHLNRKWCKGCYICLEVCPKKVFEKSSEVSEKGFQPVLVAHPELCTGCLQCEMLCPDLAINVEKGE
jgi:2-oxoglutarate ferredoxin oxidoreductase subunit delta